MENFIYTRAMELRNVMLLSLNKDNSEKTFLFRWNDKLQSSVWVHGMYWNRVNCINSHKLKSVWHDTELQMYFKVPWTDCSWHWENRFMHIKWTQIGIEGCSTMSNTVFLIHFLSQKPSRWCPKFDIVGNDRLVSRPMLIHYYLRYCWRDSLLIIMCHLCNLINHGTS